MFNQSILIWPDRDLLLTSVAIKNTSLLIKLIIRDMIATLENTKDAIGLAAPQIGIPVRIFVLDRNICDSDYNEEDLFCKIFINPVAFYKNGSFEWQEGCLSIPGELGRMRRFYTLDIYFTDFNEKLHTQSCTGQLAGCYQHEMDHLDGKLWVDFQSPLKKEILKRKMKNKFK